MKLHLMNYTLYENYS